MAKPTNLRTYLENQMVEMLKHKWIKGVHLGKDPGEAACIEWVQKHGEEYRKSFNGFFDEVIANVITKTREKLNPKLCLSEEELFDVAKILIVEFTNQWLIERIKPLQNKHAGEI